jgi:hypothetical protein
MARPVEVDEAGVEDAAHHGNRDAAVHASKDPDPARKARDGKPVTWRDGVQVAGDQCP